ncbi:hypothetical protein QYE76_071221 [Lolium multiflorum]|uniref:Uncharacterized protein n=1 Tax=Lolium multiflorum TaxID=4521 RepID=A0AAD8WED8_LOLMU|nr:hypothetical protein QYE76_071221 [Lolium multiflorum]
MMEKVWGPANTEEQSRHRVVALQSFLGSHLFHYYALVNASFRNTLLHEDLYPTLEQKRSSHCKPGTLDSQKAIALLETRLKNFEEENAKRPSIDDLSAKIKVLEAENESLKNFMKESSVEENKKRKELLEKHAQEVSDLAEKLKKSHQRVQTLASKNKSYEAEAEAIDKMIFHMASQINFNQFLEKEKLKSNGSNFTDWSRHVRIFLNGGNLQYVLDAPLGDPAATETDEVKNVYATWKTRYSQVQCAILCSLEADLQKRFEHHDPHELINELKNIFETHAAVECYEASKHFFSCMMEEGSSVSEHMLAMTGHAKKLSDLGIVIPNRLGINRVLQSLPPSYKNFVMNYNMHNMNKELPELFAMLKSAEIEIKKEHQVLMVNKTNSFNKQGKSKGKNKKSGKRAATPPVKPKTGPKPSAITARRRDT